MNTTCEFERESYPPCTATVEELRQELAEELDNDHALLNEGRVPDDLEDEDEISEWMARWIDEMQSLLDEPSDKVDAVLRACRDRALAWLKERYTPSAFLDTTGAHLELLMGTRYEFEDAFFRGEFGDFGQIEPGDRVQ